MADLPPVVAAAPADARFGKFVRVVRLGVGAYGEVWKAWDTELSRWVALKFLKQEGGEELARFLREARTAASLSHANIAAIYEIGEAQGHHYIAMQFVDGRTLRGFPRGDRRRIVTIVRDAAIAIEAAHDRAIVHRDLKPDNLMVDAAGRVYVMDFGLARPVEKGSGMTASGMAVGTPAYMSPEQARGDVAEERSDVYGLGATLYDLLAGRPPFDGANLVDLLMAVVEREPVAPRRLDPALEPELETIVLKTLEKDPAKRYPSMRALRDDLDRWLRGEPIEAQPLSTIAKFARGVRRQKVALPMAGALLLLLTGAAVFYAIQHGRARGEFAREAAERERREASIQRLAAISQRIVDRKSELRRAVVPAAIGRADLRAAVREAEEHARRWPEEPPGHYLRARGLMYLGEFEEAERAARRSIETQAGFRPGWALLGSVILEQTLLAGYGAEATREERSAGIVQRLSEAAAAFHRGWERGREREEAARWGLPWSREDQVMETLGRAQLIYAETKDARQVSALVKSVMEEYHSEDLARFLSMAVSGEERMRTLDLALQWAPGYELAWLDRGNLKRALGDLKGALSDYDRALECHADFAMALLNRGSVKSEMKDPADGLADIDRVIALRPDWYLPYVQRGGMKTRLGDAKGAVADYTRAIEMSKGGESVRVFRAQLRYSLGDEAGALEDYEQEIAAGTKDPDAYIGRSCCRRRAKDYEAAFRDAQVAIRLGPDHSDSYAELGNVLAAMLRREEAVRAYDKALELQPENLEALTRRGMVRLALGDAGGMRDFDHVINSNPRHGEARHQRALKRLDRGELIGAIEDLDVAIDVRPTHAALWNTRGYAKQRQGRLDEAIADYDRSIALREDSGAAWYNRGNAKKEKQQYDAALADFNRAIELNPAHAEAYVQRGLTKKAQGDLAAAIEDYTRAIAKNDRLFEAFLNRGNARSAIREDDGALGDYARAIELRPSSADVLHSRAILHGTRKDWGKAAADLEKALEIAPENWSVRRSAEARLEYARKQQ